MPSSLRELRESRGLSFAQVAVGVDVAEVTVRNWESGFRHPGLRMLRKLSAFYGLRLDQMDDLLPKTDAS